MSVRTRLKTRARQRLPLPVVRVLTTLSHQLPSHRRFLELQRRRAASRRIVDDRVVHAVGSMTVTSGPFAGMRLTRDAVWGSDFSARLLGTYEKELHPVLDRWIEDLSLVVDVGCADGYYVVGLARAAPGASVVAYDIDPAALDATRRLAALNGAADRVEVRGRCDSQHLCALPTGTVVLMDCEGAEVDLLTTEVAATNPDTRFIIECHDSIVPGTTRRLTDLFAGRTVTTVWPSTRRAESVASSSISTELALEAMDEGRDMRNPWIVVE